MKELSFVVRDSEEEDLVKLVDMKRISERELDWEPPEEYLKEFSRALVIASQSKTCIPTMVLCLTLQ